MISPEDKIAVDEIIERVKDISILIHQLVNQRRFPAPTGLGENLNEVLSEKIIRELLQTMVEESIKLRSFGELTEEHNQLLSEAIDNYNDYLYYLSKIEESDIE